MKNVTDLNTSKFTKKADLCSLNSDVDKLDISQLQTTAVDLSKLNDDGKNKLVKNKVYDELVKSSE